MNAPPPAPPPPQHAPPPPPTKQKFDAFTTIAAVLALILAVWFFFADIPPVPQLVNFQADIFDSSYYPKLTMMVTWLILFLPLWGIVKLIQMSLNK